MSPARVPPLYIQHGWRDGVRSIFATRQEDGLPPNTADFFGQNAVPLDSGRSALTAALSVLPLPKKARIGVPVYTCSAVFDAIAAAGHIPVFLDIELDYYTIDPAPLAKIKDGLDALVAVHTFGHPFDFDAVRTACGDIPIIEDCAHAMTAEYKGKRIGSFGDAAIYSLRPGKLLGSGGGGMLVLRNPDLAKESSLESKMSHSSRGRLFIHYLQAMAGGMLNRSLSALDSRPDSSHMKIGRMTPGDLALLERRLPSLPSIVAAHRRNASALLNALSGGTFQLPLASRAVTHDYYLFALRFHSEDGRARAQARLRRAGIGAFQLYRVALEKARAHGYRGDCPNAETAARNVVMLPVHPKVSEVAIGLMSDQLSQFRDVDR